MNKKKVITIALLHIMLMVYSMSGICSKMASKQEFLSLRFILYYAGVIVLLAVYAVAWQQIIKRISLTLAYANRAVTVVWGLVWGMIFFHEQVTVGKAVGAMLVVAGVVFYALADNKQSDDKAEECKHNG